MSFISIFDRLPFLTGAYININGQDFFYSTLNDRSRIVLDMGD
jgi:hypothetical protein